MSRRCPERHFLRYMVCLKKLRYAINATQGHIVRKRRFEIYSTTRGEHLELKLESPKSSHEAPATPARP